MDVEILVPLGFFAMIAYIVKLISDNRLRRKVLNSAASENMAEALLDRQWAEPRTRSALKWGLIFFSLGIGVLFVDLLTIGFESPLAYAILLLATGLALLGFYAIERDASDETRSSDDVSGATVEPTAAESMQEPDL
jgi:hypothetical protein